MHHLQQSGLFFFGVDETAEDVFHLKEELALGVRVGRYHESRALYYLNHQSEMEEVIRLLVQRIDRTPKSSDQGEI